MAVAGCGGITGIMAHSAVAANRRFFAAAHAPGSGALIKLPCSLRLRAFRAREKRSESRARLEEVERDLSEARRRLERRNQATRERVIEPAKIT